MEGPVLITYETASGKRFQVVHAACLQKGDIVIWENMFCTVDEVAMD